MKNKKGLIIGIIIGIVLIIAGVLLIFLLPKKSKNQMYVDALKKSLGLTSDDTAIEEKIKEIQKKLEKNNYKLTIKTNESQAEAGYKNSEDVIYIGNMKGYFKEVVTSNDMTYIYEGMLKDNKLYLGVKDYLDNIYYTDKIDELLAGLNSDDSEYDKYIKYIEDAFTDAINSKEVEKSSTELKINGTTYKTTLYSYTFTGETLRNTIANLCESLKKDKDFYKVLNDLIKQTGNIQGNFNLTKEAADAVLDQFVAMADQLKSIGKLATYSVYEYKDEIIGMKANFYSEKPAEVEYYVSSKDDKPYASLLIKSDNETYDFVFNNGDISLSKNKEELVKGYIKENDGKLEFKLYGAKDDSNYVLLSINSDYSGTFKIVSDLVTRESEFKLEKVDEIPEMDVTNSLPFEEITESDYQKFMALVGMSLNMYQDGANTLDQFNGLDM